MKIGRNEACPCGSGKKYKKCCLEKTKEQKFAEDIIDSRKISKRKSHIKQCLHPNNEECSNKIVKAHAIQNNRILSKLALDGCVITMDGQSKLLFQNAQKKGRKIATIFTGFCSYHDKVLFQAIEDKEFNYSREQIFLWTYRTLAWHYHKKQEQINANNIFSENMIARGYKTPQSIEYRNLTRGFNIVEQDNNKEKEIFDKYLLSNTYENLSFCIWEIPYEISFAVSMMHGLEYNIKGNKLNDYVDDGIVKNIYLNIFPCEQKSYCIWSWLKDYDDIYIEFTNQFMELDIKHRENYLNNKLPRWTDSIIISPCLWNEWGSDIQKALITHANFDILYLMREREKSLNEYEYMYTPWNFFRINNI
jgi:hypothetical protein